MKDIMRVKVLVLDDDINKANLIKIWLEQYNADVDIVCSYAEALNRVSVRYDYLVVDYFLDSVSKGDEFVAIYQKRHSDCEVLIYSGAPERLDPAKNVVDFGNLQSYLQKHLKIAGDNGELYQYYEIKFLKDSISDQNKKINEIQCQVGSHDKQINSMMFSLNSLQNSSVEIVTSIKEMKNDFKEIKEKNASNSKEIILWVTGIVVVAFGAFMMIEWEMFKYLFEKFMK